MQTGTPSSGNFTALYARQGLSTCGDNPVAKSGGEDSFCLGKSIFHQTVPAADADTALLKRNLQKQQLLALQKVLDIIRS